MSVDTGTKMNIVEFREWTMWIAELGILYYVAREFHYDERKDLEKKQRRTKTTKKATTMPDGTTVTEENIETTESKGETDVKSN